MPYNSAIERADVDGIIPVEYSNEFVAGIAESSHVMRLARRLRDMSRYQNTLPILSALATGYFTNGDTGLNQTTEMEWTDKVIQAEEVNAIVPIPRNVIRDASINLWEYVREDLITALGVVIDNAVLHGTNKPTSWPTAIVTAAASASNTVALGTGADLYEDLLDEGGVFSKVELDGYMVTGSLAHLVMRGKLRGVRDADGQPIFSRSMQEANNYLLDGAPIDFPTNGTMVTTAPLIAGDWSRLVYSMRQDMEWEMSNQAVIQDSGGNIVYNLFQQNMVAMKVTMRLGFQVPNPINRVNSTAATRYPFATLTDS